MASPDLSGRRRAGGALAPLAALLVLLAGCGDAPPDAPARPAPKAALTVTLIQPATQDWPQHLAANGNVLAWQEALVGAELAGERLRSVEVQVGDTVKKGQVLARLDDATIRADVDQARAAVAELEAAAREAAANAVRARDLQERGFYSKQMGTQYLTAEAGAEARLSAARARLQMASLRLAKTVIQAPDDGVIAAAPATVGSLTQTGQELFRLIRQGRLEWQAEVPAADIASLHPGGAAEVLAPDGTPVAGSIRAISPSIDPKTRNGLVFVDFSPSTVKNPLRAGMFARGRFDLGPRPARVVPQEAVVLREGFAYVYQLEGEDRVAQRKVETGRRQGHWVEITGGLAEDARIVATGAGFLADGDRIQIAPDSRP